VTIVIFIIIIVFSDIIHRQSFEDWILSPSSGKSLLNWAQSIEMIGFYLRTERESSLRKEVHNNCINISSSQTLDRTIVIVNLFL
jgi:hypothetical protein